MCAARLAARQHGQITFGQLVAGGLDKDATASGPEGLSGSRRSSRRRGADRQRPWGRRARPDLDAGLEHPVVNALLLAGGTPYHPDLRWPGERLSLEIDSSPWHDGRLAQELDAGRQADLEATGERVLRTTRAQALLAPQQLITRLLAAGALHARAVADIA